MQIFDEPVPKDKQINVHMSAAEKDRLDKAAAAAGLSVSEYIRRAVNEKAEREENRQNPKKRS